MSMIRYGILAGVLFGVAVLASCAGSFPSDIPENYTAPEEYTFTVPYERAWQETVKTMAAGNRIKTMDKKSGVIVTESAPIDKDLSPKPVKAAMSLRDYSNSYSVTLSAVGPGRTKVKVRAELTEELLSHSSRQCHTEKFTAFLRQELFRRICDDLYGNPAECSALFPRYNSAVCLKPAPPILAPGDDIAVPGLDPKWKAEIDITDLQKALLRAGYNPGPIDGKVGRKTRAALIRFQKANRLEPTGRLDESTMIALEI